MSIIIIIIIVIIIIIIIITLLSVICISDFIFKRVDKMNRGEE